MQYFLGLQEYIYEDVFDRTLFTTLRYRLGADKFDAMTRQIILTSEGKHEAAKKDLNDHSNNINANKLNKGDKQINTPANQAANKEEPKKSVTEESKGNKGILIVDATVADQLWEIATQDQDAAHMIWALRAFARVLPQLAREQPDQVASRLQTAMSVAERDEDKRLILSRLPAVRSEVALTLALSCLEQAALRSDAIEVTAELGEAMKDTHPKAARAALETIRPLTDNSDLVMHIDKILWNMQLKGN